ncbi:MAG: helix-turn-helix transcriptional regulator [Bacilli bacterium]|nr:helix-turn-helix transcriptional regulator [Bacilli bacterium]MDD3841712.1 helix-turn-helix transcriptional regulator [Bacilli bacterium]
MDPVKIGNFIRNCRKEKGFTQEELANKIFVSPKTISKWECGNGTPDVSIMARLCQELDINLNELFSGERLDDKKYKINAEKNLKIMVDLERERNKKALVSEIVLGIAVTLASLTLFILSAFFAMEVYQRVILILIGVVVFLLGIAGLLIIEHQNGYFECPNCGEVFRPTFKQYFMGLHTITKRRLKCPNCEKTSLCQRRLSKNSIRKQN